MTIVRYKIKRLDRRIGRISAMHRLAVVADDHILHETPHDVIENRDAEEREAVRPRNEDRAEDDERDAGRAIEIFLKVELIVSARRTTIDDRARVGSDDIVDVRASLARAQRLAGFARQSRFAVGTEEVDGGHEGVRFRREASGRKPEA